MFSVKISLYINKEKINKKNIINIAGKLPAKGEKNESRNYRSRLGRQHHGFCLNYARGVARKVVLIDANEKKAQAEAMDIAHATPFAYANKVKAGTYEDLKGCEIVIVTAGANQKPGETRIRPAWPQRQNF